MPSAHHSSRVAGTWPCWRCRGSISTHTSRSGSEMWKQRRCTGKVAEGARQQAGNGSWLWAALGSSGKDVAASLGDRPLALPVLQDQV